MSWLSRDTASLGCREADCVGAGVAGGEISEALRSNVNPWWITQLDCERKKEWRQEAVVYVANP